jgi:hypothetical protein
VVNGAVGPDGQGRAGQRPLVVSDVGLREDPDQPVALLHDQRTVQLVLASSRRAACRSWSGRMVTRSLVAISSQRTVLGSRLAATTRATRSRSVTMATTRSPSTTGRAFLLGDHLLGHLGHAHRRRDGDHIGGHDVPDLGQAARWLASPAAAPRLPLGRGGVGWKVCGGGWRGGLGGRPSPARCLPVLRRRPGPGPLPRGAGCGRPGGRRWSRWWGAAARPSWR